MLGGMASSSVRQEITDQPQNDPGKMCVVCNSPVMTDMNTALLKPCNHRCCKDCAIDALAGRLESNGRARCPIDGCTSFLTAVDRRVHQMTGGGRESRSIEAVSSRRLVVKSKSTKVTSIEHDVRRDPFRDKMKNLALAGGVRSIPAGGTLLVAAWSLHVDKGRLGWFDLSFELSSDGSRRPSDADIDGLLVLMAKLKRAIVPLDSRKKKKTSGQIASAADAGDVQSSHRRAFPLKDILDRAVKDKRILPKMFLNLISIPNAEEVLEKAEYQQRLGVAHMMTDVVMRTIDPQQEIAEIVNLITFLFDSASPTELRNVLSKLRLVTTRDASRRARALEFLQRMTDRYDIGDRALFLFSADNIQWLYEWMAMYDHWFSCLHWDRPEDRLIEMGILVDGNPEDFPPDAADADDEMEAEGVANDESIESTENTAVSTPEVPGRLSREPRVAWSEHIVENTTREVLDGALTVRDGNIDHRGEVELCAISLIIGLLVEGRLPWSADGQARNSRMEVAWPDGIPLLHRLCTKNGISESNISDTHAQYQEGGIVKKEGITRALNIYKANGLITSIGIHLNFNNTESIEGIADYAERVRRAQIKAFEKRCESMPNKGKHLDRPPSEDILAGDGDGAPVLMVDKLQCRERKKGSDKYSKVRFYLGGFHVRGHHFETTNEVYQEIISFLVSGWTRASRSKLNFYLDPADINKPEREMGQIVIGIITFVVERMTEAGTKPTEISAVSTLDFFIDQAKKCTVAMTLLLIMEEYLTVILYRIAAGESDFDKFMSANKLSYPLKFANHSTNYARLFARLFQNFVERSPFEDAIHRKCCYTGVSENGENVECDLIHEKHNGVIRKATGKAVRRGHEANVEHACMTADATSEIDHDNVKRAYEDADLEAENRIDSWQQGSEALFGVLTQLRKMDVMNGGGYILVSGKKVDTSKEMVSPFTGKPMPAFPLRLDTSMVEASEEYFTQFHIKTQDEDSRASFKFPRVPNSSSGVNAEIKKRVVLATSLIDDELAGNGTREELYSELNALVVAYYDGSVSNMSETLVLPDVKKNGADALKANIIASLINVRQEVFRGVETAQEDLARKAKESCSSAITEEERSEILSSRRHKLTESLRTDPVFTKKYRFGGSNDNTN